MSNEESLNERQNSPNYGLGIRLLNHFKKILVWISSTALWDYLYLCAFVTITFLLPSFMTKKTMQAAIAISTGDEATSIEFKSDMDITTPDLVTWAMMKILFAMGYIPLVPIVGAFIIRIFFYPFLKQLSLEKDARQWVSQFLIMCYRYSLIQFQFLSFTTFFITFDSMLSISFMYSKGIMFVLVLRILHFNKKCRDFFLFLLMNVGTLMRKCTNKNPSLHSETDINENLASLENIDNTIMPDRDNEKEENDELSMYSSSSNSSSFSEVEVSENEIVWTCIICKEVNVQEKKYHNPIHRNHTFGTEENASRVQIIIENVGNLENQYKVKFKQRRNVNYCRKCATPCDYRPRNRSLQQNILHPSINKHVNKNEDEVNNESNSNMTDEIATIPKDHHVDSFHVASIYTTWQILKSPNLTIRNKCLCIRAKIISNYKKYFIERTDPPLVEPNNERRLYYNNHYSQQYILKHTPTLARKALEIGERYEKGMWIESTEERPNLDWYPGRIVKVRQNNKYDIRYDNGEFIQCVDGEKIRFRLTFQVTPVLRITTVGLLRIIIICPLSLSHDIWMNEIKGEEGTVYFERILRHMIIIVRIIPIILFLSQMHSFWMTARSGPLLHIKLYVFWSLPYWMLLISSILLRHNISLSATETSRLQWWKCLITCIGFSMTSIIHFFCMGLWLGYFGIFLSIPLIIFEILMALVGDGIIEITSNYLLFFPLQCFAIFLLPLRCLVPYLREPYF